MHMTYNLVDHGVSNETFTSYLVDQYIRTGH